MSGFIILIIIVGTVIGVFTIFIVKSFVTPRVMENLVELLKQGKNYQVIRQTKLLIDKDSRNIDAHYLLGRAYLAEEKPELALMEFKIVNQIGQFTALCPEVPFRKQAAQLFRKFNQHEEALKEYLLLIKKEPLYAEHYYQTGELFEERQMSDRALVYYQKAIEINKNHSGAHLRLGILYSRQKKPLEARAELEIALKCEPENYKANFYMGRLLKEMHDYGAALRSFEKAQKDPDLKLKALIETGTCYMSMNDLERAISTLERSVNLAADHSSTEMLYSRYFLALCYEQRREIDKAIEHWEFIYSKKPSFKDVAQKLSQYQDLRADDRMKDYLTAAPEEFMEICKAIIIALKLEVRDIAEIKNGCQVSAAESEKDWRITRRMPRLVMFMRVTELIDESTVRSLHEKMKRDNITRGVIITSSGFTRKANEFAETRPIDLFDKEKLSGVLKKVKI